MRTRVVGSEAPSGPLARFLVDPGSLFAELWSSISGFFAAWWPAAAPSAVAVLGAVFGSRLVLRSHQHSLMDADARVVEVQVPPNVNPAAAEAFWSHLHALLRPTWRRFWYGQPHLVFEYCFVQRSVSFRIWVPGLVPSTTVEAAISAAWPGSRTIVHSPPPVPMPVRSVVTGGRLRLARNEALPTRTGHHVDPLSALLAAAQALTAGEAAAVQVLARPATGARTRRFRRQLGKLRLAASGVVGQPLQIDVFDAVTLGMASKAPNRFAIRIDPVAAAALRQAVVKNSGSLWETEIRYAVGIMAGAGREQQVWTRRRLRGLAHGFASAFGMHSGLNWWARKPLHRPDLAMARRRLVRGHLISTIELAALAHLPLDGEAAGVVRAGARCVAPPPQVAANASGSPFSARLLGDSDAGTPSPVALRIADGRQHTHILGATGCGKSTLMGRMILDDVAARRGVVVIDPKGDLVADVLDRLPDEARNRAVLIDPLSELSDGERRPCLNVLAEGDPELMVDNLVGIFRRIFAASWGPRTDDVLRAACLTLLATAEARTRPPTLAGIPRLLADPNYRERVVRELPDDRSGPKAASIAVLNDFWDGYRSLSEAGRQAVCAPLLNKLRAFLLRDFVAQTVAREQSTVDLRQVLDGGILLVRLPKGVLGDETTRLLGSFIVAALWQAASERAKSAQGARVDASLYIDETANFLNLPYPLEDMLAEARGYRLSLVLAHQNLAQLTPELREGISANTRNKVFFTCSPEDAKALAPHVAPQLTEHDLAHLDGYQAAVRLAVDGARTPAFTMRTRPLPGSADGPGPAVPVTASRIQSAAVPGTDAAYQDTITRKREVRQP
jgi:hypothetical protein